MRKRNSVEIGTGFSVNAAANQTCTQAKNELGTVQAAVRNQFPEIPVCRRIDGFTGYTGYTEEETTIDTSKSIAIIAIGGDVNVKS